MAAKLRLHVKVGDERLALAVESDLTVGDILKSILLKYRKLFGVTLPYEGTQLRLEGSVLDLDDAASDLIRDEALLEVSQIGNPLHGAPSPIFSSLPVVATPLPSRQKRKDGPEDMPSTVKAERSEVVHSDGKKLKGDERRSTQSPIIAATPSIPASNPSKRNTAPAPPARHTLSDDESNSPVAAPAAAKRKASDISPASSQRSKKSTSPAVTPAPSAITPKALTPEEKKRQRKEKRKSGRKSEGSKDSVEKKSEKKDDKGKEKDKLRAEKEAKEKDEREAKEKKEREEKEKREKEAKAEEKRKEKEAKANKEKDEAERKEREAKEEEAKAKSESPKKAKLESKEKKTTKGSKDADKDSEKEKAKSHDSDKEKKHKKKQAPPPAQTRAKSPAASSSDEGDLSASFRSLAGDAAKPGSAIKKTTTSSLITRPAPRTPLAVSVPTEIHIVPKQKLKVSIEKLRKSTADESEILTAKQAAAKKDVAPLISNILNDDERWQMTDSDTDKKKRKDGGSGSSSSSSE